MNDLQSTTFFMRILEIVLSFFITGVGEHGDFFWLEF